MRARTFGLISLLRSAFPVIVLWLFFSANAAGQDIIDLQIPHFTVSNVTMEEALKKLNAWGIQVCLEKVPRQREEIDVRFSANLRDASVREVLNALVSADKRYTWERYQQSFMHTALINVLPIGAKMDAENLMNIKARKVVINYDNPPENIIAKISYFIPEIARKLYPGGVAGSIASGTGGNMNLVINFEFQDMTVREILNEMVLRTAGLGWVYEHVKSADDQHRWRVLGWGP